MISETCPTTGRSCTMRNVLNGIDIDVSVKPSRRKDAFDALRDQEEQDVVSRVEPNCVQSVCGLEVAGAAIAIKMYAAQTAAHKL